MAEQLLNEIAARLPKQGLLEKLACRDNDEIHFGENTINWNVEAIETDSYIKSHTSGSAVAANARGSAYSFTVSTPFYITKRAISADDLVARVGATGGYSAEGALAKILGSDLKFLSRDIVASVEKQVSLLLFSSDVEYVNDANSTINVPTFTGSDPCAHTQTAMMDAGAIACIDEMVSACIAKGFMPDALVLGSTAAADFLADTDVQALGKNNQWVPALIELSPRDGGSYLGRIASKYGATIEVYACNESVGGTALVSAKSGVMLQTGCCSSCVGVVPTSGEMPGEWAFVGDRLVPSFTKGEIDNTLVLASRVLVLPNSHAWQYASAITT